MSDEQDKLKLSLEPPKLFGRKKKSDATGTAKRTSPAPATRRRPASADEESDAAPTEEPTDEVVEDAVTQELDTAEPAAEETAAEEPVVEEPVAEETIADQPMVGVDEPESEPETAPVADVTPEPEPAPEPAAAPEPDLEATPQKAAEPAATTKPAATKPAATKPAVTKPAVTKPAVTKPAAAKPAASKPAITKPAAKPAAKATPKPAAKAATTPPKKPAAAKVDTATTAAKTTSAAKATTAARAAATKAGGAAKKAVRPRAKLAPDIEPEPVSRIDQEDAEIVARADEPPLLSTYPAAAVTGAVAGAAMIGLIVLSLRGCEAVRNSATCTGGPGFVLLVATFVACVLLGSALLKVFSIPDPGSTSFLGVGLVAVVALLFLIDALEHWSMLIVIPIISVGAFLASVWVTETFVEPGAPGSDASP